MIAKDVASATCTRCGHTAGSHGYLINEPRSCDAAGCDCPGMVFTKSTPPDPPSTPPASGAFAKMQLVGSVVLPPSPELAKDPRPDGVYFRGVTDGDGARDVFCAVVEEGRLTSEKSLRVDEYSWSGVREPHMPDFGPEAVPRATWALSHALMQLAAPDINANRHIDVMTDFVRQLPAQWAIAAFEVRRLS